ncbi:MAG TPA: YcxB family protein [Candidatus Acidoferrum sp.]
MDSIHLSFRYEERDYVRAMRSHYASRLRLKTDIIAIVLGGALGIYACQSLDSPWWGVVLVCSTGLLALLLVAAFTVLPKRLFRGEPKFRDEYSLTFSGDGIHFQTVHIDSHLQWSMYHRATVDRHSFILYHGTAAFSVIPKRVFESDEQRLAFERLITQKIPKMTNKMRKS